MATSGVDKSDPLLTMDVVREFMLSKGGKIRNHELVGHFRNFLNDPIRKVANREKIKIFVNTLAVVKLDETGDKVLTLKKKYRESGNFDGDPTVNTTSAAPQAKTKESVKKKEGALSKTKDLSKKSQSFDNLTEKTVELEGAEDYVLISKDKDKSKSLDIPDNDEVEHSAKDLFCSPVPAQDFPSTQPSSVSSVEEETAVVETSVVLTEALKSEKMDEEDSVASPAEPLVEEKHEGESSDVPSIESTDHPDRLQPPSVDPPDQLATPKSATVLVEPASGGLNVKEVALSLNKLESDGQGPLRPLALKNKRENRKAPPGDDGSGDYTMSFTELDRDWLMASANCDYMTMMKMLQTNPQLAKKRDFITGYAPLHWAAKHGNEDVIKLLCGQGAVVNVRTNGGYTPLHLAAMQDSVPVVELLVSYGADPNIRDYSGKKPKQWIHRSASAHMSQLLQARRGTSHGGHTPVEAPTHDSAFGKAMFLGLGVVGLRTSMGKENAPLPRPVSSSKDDELMPPPSMLPPVLRAKPIARQKDVHSDSEMSSAIPENKIHSSDSSPSIGTIV